MSNLRERAAEIKAAGEEERGNFTPTGVPLRMYEFWNSISDKGPRVTGKKENFCHFWRVVVFWAPLFAVLYAVVAVADNRAVRMVSYVGTAALVLFALFTFGLAPMDFLIGAGLGAALIAVGGTVGFGLYKFGCWVQDWPDRVQIYAMKTVIGGLITGGVVAIGSIIVSAAMAEGWLLVLGGIGIGLVSLVALIAFMTVLIDFIAGRRKLAKQRALDEWEAFYAKHGMSPETAKRDAKAARGPSKFWTGVADVLIFLGQIVRVNKWKVCPLVEIDSGEKV